MAAWLAAGVLIAGQADARAPARPGARPPESAVVARLVAALKDPDLDVRLALGQALARMPAAAVGPLGEALRDADPMRRAGAAYALGLIGEPAAAALPNLLDALDDPELEVRRQSARAVGRVMVPRASPRPLRPEAVRR